MLEGRFFLGVGSGENLNEHILGDRWPPAEIRQEMLEEAVEVMRELWKGEFVTHRGRHYTVENARIYDPPDGGSLPVYVAAAGPTASMRSPAVRSAPPSRSEFSRMIVPLRKRSELMVSPSNTWARERRIPNARVSSDVRSPAARRAARLPPRQMAGGCRTCGRPK